MDAAAAPVATSSKKLVAMCVSSTVRCTLPLVGRGMRSSMSVSRVGQVAAL